MTIPTYSAGTEVPFIYEGVVVTDDISAGGLLIVQTSHNDWSLNPTIVKWRVVQSEDPLILGAEITPEVGIHTANTTESPTRLSIHVGWFAPNAVGATGRVGIEFQGGDVASGSYVMIGTDALDCQLESNISQYGTEIYHPAATFDTVQNLVLRVGIDHEGGVARDRIRVTDEPSEASERPNSVPVRHDEFSVETARSISGLTVVLSSTEAAVLGGADLYLDGLDLGPAATQNLIPATAISGPVARGPIITQPDTVDLSDITVEVYPADAPNDLIRNVDQFVSVRFQDQLNDTGSAELVLLNDDPDLADIDDGSLVRISVKGYAALSMVVRDRQQMTISNDEEHGEVTTLSGPGHLALLDASAVYPARGVRQLPIEDDRVFNWAAVDYNDDSWIDATAIAQQNATTTYWHDSDGVPYPPDWPDGSAYWIWAHTGTQEWAPAGICYFRRTFTIAEGVNRIIVYLTADDSATLYIDGQKILDTDNQANDPTEIRTQFVDVTPGQHVLAAAVTNAPDPEDDEIHNPAGLLVSVYPVDSTGTITSATPIVNTTTDWKIVEYPPAPPGMTPGEVVRHVVEEAQARGALTGWSLRFTDDVDSDGTPWPEVTDIATKVGNDVLTFLKEICETYMDMWASPGGLELYAWVRDGRGSARSATFHTPTDTEDPETGNLAKLEHKTVESPGNTMLVRWTNGWIEVSDDSSADAHGRREVQLSLGAIQSAAEAERIATRQLQQFANPRTAISAEIAPISDTDTPYIGFLVGDTVHVPDRDGNSSAERVRAITVTQDEDGNVTFVPELKDRVLEEFERWEQGLKKMTDGTLRGQSAVASPVSPANYPKSDCCVPTPPDGGGGG